MLLFRDKYSQSTDWSKVGCQNSIRRTQATREERPHAGSPIQGARPRTNALPRTNTNSSLGSPRKIFKVVVAVWTAPKRRKMMTCCSMILRPACYGKSCPIFSYLVVTSIVILMASELLSLTLRQRCCWQTLETNRRTRLSFTLQSAGKH